MKEAITLKDSNGVSHKFEVQGSVYKPFGVDDVYALAVFYTGYIIYNTDFNTEKYEKTIILTD